MFKGTQLTGFGVGGVSGIYDFAYKGMDWDNTTKTSHTYSSVDIGTPRADRSVIVVGSANNVSNFTSCTVGGTGITELIDPATGGRDTCIYMGVIPTGSTADVVLNADSSNAWAIAVYIAYNVDQTMYDSAQDLTASYAITLDIPAGALVICGHTVNMDPTDVTWTASGQTITRDNTQDTGPHMFSSANIVDAAPNATQSISTNGSSTGSLVGVVLVGAS